MRTEELWTSRAKCCMFLYSCVQFTTLSVPSDHDYLSQASSQGLGINDLLSSQMCFWGCFLPCLCIKVLQSCVSLQSIAFPHNCFLNCLRYLTENLILSTQFIRISEGKRQTYWLYWLKFLNRVVKMLFLFEWFFFYALI